MATDLPLAVAEQLRLKDQELDALRKELALLRVRLHALTLQVREEQGRHIETMRKVRATLDQSLQDMQP